MGFVNAVDQRRLFLPLPTSPPALALFEQLLASAWLALRADSAHSEAALRRRLVAHLRQRPQALLRMLVTSPALRAVC